MTQVIKQPMNETEDQLSALMDGALNADQCADIVARLSSDPELHSRWDMYHLVGDVLRQPARPVQVHDPEFLNRLRLRLATESVSRANPVVTPVLQSMQERPRPALLKPSANDGQWRLVAGLASVVLMVTMVWQGLPWGGFTHESVGLHTAQQTALPLTGATPVMIRDPQLDALLAAQRQFSGTPTFRTPAGFLQNATFENGGR